MRAQIPFLWSSGTRRRCSQRLYQHDKADSTKASAVQQHAHAAASCRSTGATHCQQMAQFIMVRTVHNYKFSTGAEGVHVFAERLRVLQTSLAAHNVAEDLAVNVLLLGATDQQAAHKVQSRLEDMPAHRHTLNEAVTIMQRAAVDAIEKQRVLSYRTGQPMGSRSGSGSSSGSSSGNPVVVKRPTVA